MKISFLISVTCAMALMLTLFVFQASAYEYFENYELTFGKAPDFDYDMQGNIHMVWHDGHFLRYTQAIRTADGRYEFQPFATSPEIPNSNSAASMRFGLPRISVDAQGGVHFAWLNAKITEVFYAYYKDGQFLDSRRLVSGYPKFLGNCDIESDSEGRAYIAYQNPLFGWPFGIGVICYKPGQGMLWKKVMEPIDTGEEKNPVLCLNSFQPIGPQNPLYLMWKEVRCWAIYNGSNWTESMSIPEVPTYLGHADIEVDTQNRPTIAFLNWVPEEPKWWVEGAYIKTCNDFGYDWNTRIKVSDEQIKDREDYSPIAPEIALTPSGEMMVVWNNNGLLKYQIYEEGRWLDGEQELAYNNMYACHGMASIGMGDIVLINENQSNRIFFHHFRFNQSPQIYLGGVTQRSLDFGGYEIGGDLNFLVIAQDGNGLSDLASIQALNDAGQPVFNLYDDGQHGDFFPDDSIYGAILSDEYDTPGNRQLIFCQAKDQHNAVSDIYPLLSFHGGSGGALPDYAVEPVFPSWEQDYAKSMSENTGEWMVYMGGFMDSMMTVGVDSWLDIIAWVIPVHDPAMAGLDRVELMFNNLSVGFELPLMIDDPAFGRFYGTSIPIPGDELEGLGGQSFLFQLTAFDTNNRPGPSWPYVDIPNPPTPTPEPTQTPEPTETPEPTFTPRPTFPPPSTPTYTPRPTFPPYPTQTPAMTPTPGI